MARKSANPLAGMANAPVEEKLCVLMGLWVRHSKELETVHKLIELTAIVAHQYVHEALSESEPVKKKTKKAKQ